MALATTMVSACLGSRAAEIPEITLQPFAQGFTSPVALVPFPDGKGSVLVADQVGVVSLVSSRGLMRGQPFLSISDRMVQLKQGFDERGLLGLALHPRYSENGRFFVYYSAPLRQGAPEDWDHTSRISEFRVKRDAPLQADPGSERVLLEFDQPYFNHNGGCIAFGPDGYLYIASGDGGNANGTGRGHSEMGNGQDLSHLLGKILRIDVDGKEPYAIPADNPFQDEGQRGEIWAMGLRNPWRITFDRGGDRILLAADIGQTLYEEVNLVERGGNYGWNLREGTFGFDPEDPRNPPSGAPLEDRAGRKLLPPALEYKNSNGFRNDPEAKGISITGGYVYRGRAIPELEGRYVFADWTMNWVLPRGVVYYADMEGEGAWTTRKLPLDADSPVQAYITAFGEDAEGELYVLTNSSNGLVRREGKVFKLVAGRS